MKLSTFLAGPVGSWLRVAAFTMLSLWLTDLSQKGWTLDLSAYALAAVLAVGPIVLAALNPADPRFGRTG